MSISVQVLDISDYNELPTVANGYTLISTSYGATTSVLLTTPYTLGIQTFTTINIQTYGFIQFLNTTYPTISTNWSETLSGFLSRYGIAVAWDDLQAQAGDAIGYKYANNNTQIIVNYSSALWGKTALKVQAKVTINLDNHPTSPGSIRIAYGLLQNAGDSYNAYGGVLGVSYGPASTNTTTSTMNYVVSDTSTNFVYPNVPVQLFSGTANNYLTNKTIVYNIQAPNRAPVLSNNITISEIYGETTYSVNLNNYTTDLDSSLTDVIYTLNPNGSAAMPNNTTLRFWMRDSYGDTWNGGNAVIRNSSNSVIATLAGPSTNDRIWIFQDIVLSGVNTITWTTGGWPEEVNLFITSPSYSWSTSNGSPPALGGDVYYRTVGISNRTDTLNFKTATPLLGVSISGSVLTLNSTLYNCDEFYITAKNTGITYISNIATCSFTRLTAEQIEAIESLTYNGSGELTSAIVNNLLNNKPRVIIIGYSSIGASAFQDASGVTYITIPSSVTSIGANAFQGMTSLTSISIPSSVTSIEANAFLNSGLTSAIFSVSTYFSTLGIINRSASQTFFGKTGVTVSALDTKIFSGSAAVALSGATAQLDNKTNVVIEGYTNIAEGAFLNASNITQVIIPSSVTSIGANAFSQATSLTSITIPASVTSIGSFAFAYTSKLESILVDENNNYYLSLDGVLFNKEKTILLKYPTGSSAVSYAVPMSVETIHGRSFSILNYSDNNTLRTIILNSGLKKIDTFAFRYVGILSIIIPAGVTSLGYGAFLGATSLTSITFAQGSQLTSIETNTFQGATALTSVTIPSGVTSIGDNVFNGATALTSVTIPSGVTSIGNYMFYGASRLTSIIISSGVTSIGQQSFEGASSLTSITIPSSVTIIGYSVFAYTTALTSVTFETDSKLTSLGANAFYGATSLTSITIPSGVTSIAEVTFYGATSLTSITIPPSVTSIGYSAFYGASKLTSITIPEGVTSIGSNAFEGAAKLTSVTIPSGVTSIGSNAFRGSGLIKALVSVNRLGTTNFPSAAGTGQTIGGKTGVIVTSYKLFLGTGVLTNATPQLGGATSAVIVGYTSIGESAFKGATTLSTVTFRLGVGESSVLSSIGALAFENTALTTVFFESASTVKKLGLLNGDLINGYTVSSFYGKASVTFIYTEAVRSTISAAPTAIISNNTFTSLLTNMGMNISNMTSQVIPITNDPYIEYRAKLTIPNGNLSTLSDVNKANIIDTVKSLYAAQLGINLNKIIVTLESGSIIANVNVLKDGITDAMVPICFPKGTPVTTNQGVIAIEKLNPDIHTIRGKKIVAITQTRPIFEEIIAIDKNALGKNVPSAPIQISKEHKVFYKREMVKANDLVEVCEGVRRIPYNGETLYNVLMEKHDKMMINNLICETLDPDNIMAKICGGKYNRYEQSNICKELNDIIKENNVKAYIKLYDSLK